MSAILRSARSHICIHLSRSMQYRNCLLNINVLHRHSPAYLVTGMCIHMWPTIDVLMKRLQYKFIRSAGLEIYPVSSFWKGFEIQPRDLDEKEFNVLLKTKQLHPVRFQQFMAYVENKETYTVQEAVNILHMCTMVPRYMRNDKEMAQLTKHFFTVFHFKVSTFGDPLDDRIHNTALNNADVFKDDDLFRYITQNMIMLEKQFETEMFPLVIRAFMRDEKMATLKKPTMLDTLEESNFKFTPALIKSYEEFKKEFKKNMAENNPSKTYITIGNDGGLQHNDKNILDLWKHQCNSALKKDTSEYLDIRITNEKIITLLFDLGQPKDALKFFNGFRNRNRKLITSESYYNYILGCALNEDMVQVKMQLYRLINQERSIPLTTSMLNRWIQRVAEEGLPQFIDLFMSHFESNLPKDGKFDFNETIETLRLLIKNGHCGTAFKYFQLHKTEVHVWYHAAIAGDMPARVLLHYTRRLKYCGYDTTLIDALPYAIYHCKFNMKPDILQYVAVEEILDLQLELEYRKRLAHAHNEVKKRLDIMVEREDYRVEREKIMQNILKVNSLHWIPTQVLRSITPQMEKDIISQCIHRLEEIAVAERKHKLKDKKIPGRVRKRREREAARKTTQDTLTEHTINNYS